MLTTLLCGLLLWQDPEPAPAPEPPKAEAKKPVETPIPVEVWDDRTAKAAVAELTKAMKGKASMSQKNRALEQLAKGSNKLLIKPLANIIENDKSQLVRQRAAVLLANQPDKEANAAVLQLLKKPGVTAHPTVLAELVRALSHCGYAEKNWAAIDDLFEQDYAAERMQLQEAILELVTKHKERQALPMLLRNFDEPAPEDPHGADNPPAEYWEARWKAWAAWRARVKEAVFAVTGQRFTSAAEAKAWLQKNPL